MLFVVEGDYQDGVSLTSDVKELDLDKMHDKAHEMVCTTMSRIRKFLEMFIDQPDPSERVRPIKPENN